MALLDPRKNPIDHPRHVNLDHPRHVNLDHPRHVNLDLPNSHHARFHSDLQAFVFACAHDVWIGLHLLRRVAPDYDLSAPPLHRWNRLLNPPRNHRRRVNLPQNRHSSADHHSREFVQQSAQNLT